MRQWFDRCRTGFAHRFFNLRGCFGSVVHPQAIAAQGQLEGRFVQYSPQVALYLGALFN
jgi:hypothetical protein